MRIAKNRIVLHVAPRTAVLGILLLGLAGALLQPSAAAAQTPDPNDTSEATKDAQIIKNAREGRSAGQVLLFYIPNRIFDLTDLLRLRVRVGPGLAARVRVTEGVDVGLGSYTSLFVGLPGPRQAVALPLPIGLETYTGIELGPADAEVDGGVPPNYSPTEIGASVHAAVVGIDLGLDPVELLDWVAGLVLLDLRADDY